MELIIDTMRTKKQVILYFDTVSQCKEGITFLCNMNIVFDCLKYKYVRISQKAFKKCDCIDLYTGCTNIFSSII